MEKISNKIKEFLNLPIVELINIANNIRKENIGNKLEFCNILNAKSGLCSEDCKFCAQSKRYSTFSPVYPLKGIQEIVESAKYAKNIGAEKFGIVTSGRGVSKKEIKIIASAIKEIKKSIGINVCASLGKIDKEDLSLLKEAGLVRYHHNIETSKRFYKEIVSTHTFEERLETIKNVKEVGLEICSGGIIGLGENWFDRIEMANILKDLGVDSVPINFLVPIKGTPLDNRKPVSLEDAIRTICIFRIILKDKIIKVAAGRETTFFDAGVLIYMAGANGMLIGGYLTIKGRDLTDDYKLIRQVNNLWNG